MKVEQSIHVNAADHHDLGGCRRGVGVDSRREDLIQRDAMDLLAELVPRSVPDIGLEFVETASCELSMRLHDPSIQVAAMHERMLTSLISATCAVVALRHFYPIRRFGSINLDLRFLKALRSGKVIAKGAVLRGGPSAVLCEVSVVDADGELIGEARSELVLNLASYSSQNWSGLKPWTSD